MTAPWLFPVAAWIAIRALLQPFRGNLTGWDAIHYQHIATLGYSYNGGSGESIGYFPLYPLAIRLASWFGLEPAWAGELIAMAAGCASAVLMFEWLRLRGFESRERILGVLALLLFPFSLFLYGPIYSDSMFVALALGAFVLLELDRTVAACAVTGLATATRPAGVALIIAMVILVLQRDGVLLLRWGWKGFRPASAGHRGSAGPGRLRLMAVASSLTLAMLLIGPATYADSPVRGGTWWPLLGAAVALALRALVGPLAADRRWPLLIAAAPTALVALSGSIHLTAAVASASGLGWVAWSAAETLTDRSDPEGQSSRRLLILAVLAAVAMRWSSASQIVIWIALFVEAVLRRSPRIGVQELGAADGLGPRMVEVMASVLVASGLFFAGSLEVVRTLVFDVWKVGGFMAALGAATAALCAVSEWASRRYKHGPLIRLMAPAVALLSIPIAVSLGWQAHVQMLMLIVIGVTAAGWYLPREGPWAPSWRPGVLVVGSLTLLQATSFDLLPQVHASAAFLLLFVWSWSFIPDEWSAMPTQESLTGLATAPRRLVWRVVGTARRTIPDMIPAAELDLGKTRPRTLALALTPAGLVAFMLYGAVRFGDPMVYWKANAATAGGRGRPDDLAAWWKIPDVLASDMNWMSIGMALFAGALVYLFGVLALMGARRMGFGLTAYSLAMIAMILLGANRFEAAGRYLITVVPVFAVIGGVLARRSTRAQVATLALSGCAMVSCAYLFGHPNSIPRILNW